MFLPIWITPKTGSQVTTDHDYKDKGSEQKKKVKSSDLYIYIYLPSALCTIVQTEAETRGMSVVLACILCNAC